MPTLTRDFSELTDFFRGLEQSNVKVEAGVASVGPGAQYSWVWEFGSISQTKEGPKTIAGVNPVTGQKAFFSTQAPGGYIRVLIPLFRDVINREMKKVTYGDSDPGVLKTELTAAAISITKKMAELIAEHAPIDSGDLQMSIRPVAPGDTLLKSISEGGAEDGGALMMDY